MEIRRWWSESASENHRFRCKNGTRPGRGAGTTSVPPPLPGRSHLVIRFRWLTPPANFRGSLRLQRRSGFQKSLG